MGINAMPCTPTPVMDDRVSWSGYGPDGELNVLHGWIISLDHEKQRFTVAWDENPIGLNMCVHVPFQKLSTDEWSLERSPLEAA